MYGPVQCRGAVAHAGVHVDARGLQQGTDGCGILPLDSSDEAPIGGGQGHGWKQEDQQSGEREETAGNGARAHGVQEPSKRSKSLTSEELGP